MAFPVDVDGTWVNGPTFDAGELRRADAAMFASAGIASGLNVTVDGSDVVTVTAGQVVISGEDAVTGTGVYRAGIGAAVTGNLTARNATNGRIDLVVFRQLDSDVVGTHTGKTARIEIIAGTPSATPAVPAKPSMAVELGRVTVPASGGGAASVNLSNRTYSAAAGGTIPVPSESRLPTVATTGQRAVALDTLREYMWTGSAWTKLPQRTQAGRTTCTAPSGTTRYSKTITFASPFAAAPVVTPAPEATGPETVFVTVSGVSTSGFTLNWYRTIAGDFTCGWSAVAVS